jgi:hypothetical protein
MTGHWTTMEQMSAIDSANSVQLREMLDIIHTRFLHKWRTELEEEVQLVMRRVKPAEEMMMALTVRRGDEHFWEDARKLGDTYPFDIECTQVISEPICGGRFLFREDEEECRVNDASWKKIGAKHTFWFQLSGPTVIFEIECYHMNSHESEEMYVLGKDYMRTLIEVREGFYRYIKSFNNVWLREPICQQGSYWENEMEREVSVSDEDPLDLTAFGDHKPIVEACMLLLLEKREELGIGF